MLHFVTALALASAVSARVPSVKVADRDVTTVLTNLETIDTQTNTLTSTINDWDGSLLGAISISSEATELDDDVKAANTEAETESQATDEDTQTILDYITNTLGPDIDASLSALVARESDFDALGLDSTVLGIIETLQTDTDALSATLISISATDLQDEATTAAADIDAAFATAIAAFS